MTALSACGVMLAASLLGVWPQHAASKETPRETYFLEDNFVYCRALILRQNGSYLQINRTPAGCLEADHGTWTDGSDNTIRLHSTFRALRFRALVRGPLTIVLDNQEKITALPKASALIKRFLENYTNAVFDAGEAVGPVAVARDAEYFTRDDLQRLAADIDDFVAAEASHTYTLDFHREPDRPALLILRGAVFQAKDADAVRRRFRVRNRQPLPFYFTQTDAATFSRAVGTWTKPNP